MLGLARRNRGVFLPSLFDEMRKMESVFDRLSPFDRWSFSPEQMFSPGFDLYEEGDDLVVEIPCRDSEQIEICAAPFALTIKESTQAKKKTEDAPERIYHCRRKTNSFEMNISLPAEINPDSATAQTSQGILVVRMKKKTPAGIKRLEIKTEE